MRFIKKDGKIQYKENLLNNIESCFGIIPNGRYLLSIRKEQEKRSLDQNALMWLWFACIENETGQDKYDVHDHYCSRFLRRTISINGQEETVVSGTSKLNTARFSDFLDKVQSDAVSEFGIRLPNPDDLYWNEFEAYYRNFI
jgi:hypothetical protein